MDLVTKEQVRAARRADLYRFLDQCHPNEVRREGDSLRLADNHSVSIKRGYTGFYDFGTGDSGNAIECLVEYFGYDFTEAVTALCGGGAPIPPKPIQPKAPAPFILPAPVLGAPIQLTSYLTGHRWIPSEVVEYLLKTGLIYQEQNFNNIVFLNPERNYAELRGTVLDKPFRGIVPGSDLASFFWFKSHDLASVPDIAYICEGAIDAISLYCLHQVQGYAPNVLYCSIGGVANQQRIDAIKARIPTVLAVDNDDAGQQCRERNPDCQVAIPRLKDWNDDWQEHQRNRT